MAERILVVNADDFGQSPGINRGVIETHEHGIVTSASLMIRWPAAPDAAAYARAHPNLSVGLHFDLGEWALDNGSWKAVYEVVPGDDIAAVTAEIGRQLDSFRTLVGREPTHLDSHQHVHRREPARSAVLAVGRQLGIPVRHFAPDVRYCGQFYGQDRDGQAMPAVISVEGLLRTLEVLTTGWTELACHPGIDHHESMYHAERALEVQTLCDPRVRTALHDLGFDLRSFPIR